MKKLFLLGSVFMISLLGLSQGVEFEHGKWNEILIKAQQNNKPIFIDFFTSWCAPCKLMTKEIFPLENVGKIYNSNFVCYRIDAEKGEGIELAKKYKVNLFPTYLFVKSDGTIFYKGSGSMDANNFIALAKTALIEMNDPKPITVWETEYLTKKNDPTFIINYMDKRSKLGLSNTYLFDDYLKLIPAEERASETVMELYKKEGRNLITTSLAYSNLQQNISKFNVIYQGIVNTFLSNGILNTVREAAISKNEDLLSSAVSAYDKLPKNSIIRSTDEIYLEYYQRTGETDKYLKYATDLCNNQLMQISVDSIENMDKKSARLFEKLFNSGVLSKFDSSKIVQLKASSANLERNKIGNSLNRYAWEVFKKESNTKLLQNAMLWSKRSLELSPDNVLFSDTYANILYKLGHKEEAISKEEETLKEAIKENYKDSNAMEENLRKMKVGEKTW
jgi:thiol-disulfide isomerase/thioredoxin